MGRLAVVVAICTAILLTDAQAQTLQRPQGPTIEYTRPPTGGQGPMGSPSDPIILKPDLKGSLPAPTPAPQVRPQVAPPPPPRAAVPDGGGTSDCECYRMEFVDIVGRDGRLTRQHVMRSTGTKSLACCRR